jgi:signal transduction histidine kinase
MQELPKTTRFYVYSVLAAGLVSLALSIRFYGFHFSIELLTLLGLTFLLGSRYISLGTNIQLTVSQPLVFLALMKYGINEAAVVASCSALAVCLFRKRMLSRHKTVFNIASICLSVLACGEVYVLIGGEVGEVHLKQSLFPLLFSTVVCYMANTLFITVAVASLEQRPVLKTWWDRVVWSVPSYFAGTSVAVGIYYLAKGVGIYGVLLALPPCYLIYYSYRLWAERVQERERRIEEIKKLNAELEVKVRERTAELATVNEKLLQSNTSLLEADSQKSYLLAELEEKNARLLELQKFKESLMQMLVHDLKNPLQEILASVDLLKLSAPGDGASESDELCSQIEGSSEEMMEMITEILDVARLEEKKMTLNREPFAVSALARKVLDGAEAMAQQKEIRLVNAVPSELPRAFADQQLVKRVMSNLLNNALRYTGPDGFIQVGADRHPDGIVISVEDDGSGIPAEFLPRVFEKFTQAERAGETRQANKGLGLTFCKLAVEAHGGRIWVESRPGKGARFFFTLPSARERPSEAALQARLERLDTGAHP